MADAGLDPLDPLAPFDPLAPADPLAGPMTDSSGGLSALDVGLGAAATIGVPAAAYGAARATGVVPSFGARRAAKAARAGGIAGQAEMAGRAPGFDAKRSELIDMGSKRIDSYVERLDAQIEELKADPNKGDDIVQRRAALNAEKARVTRQKAKFQETGRMPDALRSRLDEFEGARATRLAREGAKKADDIIKGSKNTKAARALKSGLTKLKTGGRNLTLIGAGIGATTLYNYLTDEGVDEDLANRVAAYRMSGDPIALQPGDLAQVERNLGPEAVGAIRNEALQAWEKNQNNPLTGEAPPSYEPPPDDRASLFGLSAMAADGRTTPAPAGQFPDGTPGEGSASPYELYMRQNGMSEEEVAASIEAGIELEERLPGYQAAADRYAEAVMNGQPPDQEDLDILQDAFDVIDSDTPIAPRSAPASPPMAPGDRSDLMVDPTLSPEALAAADPAEVPAMEGAAFFDRAVASLASLLNVSPEMAAAMALRARTDGEIRPDWLPDDSRAVQLFEGILNAPASTIADGIEHLYGGDIPALGAVAEQMDTTGRSIRATLGEGVNAATEAMGLGPMFTDPGGEITAEDAAQYLYETGRDGAELGSYAYRLGDMGLENLLTTLRESDEPYSSMIPDYQAAPITMDNFQAGADLEAYQNDLLLGSNPGEPPEPEPEPDFIIDGEPIIVDQVRRDQGQGSLIAPSEAVDFILEQDEMSVPRGQYERTLSEPMDAPGVDTPPAPGASTDSYYSRGGTGTTGRLPVVERPYPEGEMGTVEMSDSQLEAAAAPLPGVLPGSDARALDEAQRIAEDIANADELNGFHTILRDTFGMEDEDSRERLVRALAGFAASDGDWGDAFGAAAQNVLRGNELDRQYQLDQVETLSEAEDRAFDRWEARERIRQGDENIALRRGREARIGRGGGGSGRLGVGEKVAQLADEIMAMPEAFLSGDTLQQFMAATPDKQREVALTIARSEHGPDVDHFALIDAFDDDDDDDGGWFGSWFNGE